jgi:ammonia channel protein AmtB
LGVKDFAGGIVIHVNAGVAALVSALVLGNQDLAGICVLRDRRDEAVGVELRTQLDRLVLLRA